MALQSPTLISSLNTNSGAVGSITFSSIPQTYTDLKIIMSIRATTGGGGVWLHSTYNGSNNAMNACWYSSGSAYGNANGYGSTSNGYNALITGAGDTGNTFAQVEWYIMNYTSSNPKTMFTDGYEENNAAIAYTTYGFVQWNTSSALTSITFTADSGNIDQYSTFYLYGISNS